MASSPITGRGLRLEKVVGVSVGSKSAFDVNPVKDGEIAYPVGCMVVIYCTESNKQRAYMRMAKPVACLKFSNDGRFLAVGEKGHNPAITVWDVRSHTRMAELKGHRFGISCVRFSDDNKRLISIGFEHDDRMIMWDWEASEQVLGQKLKETVRAMDFFGDQIVTVGVKHLRFWTIKQQQQQQQLQENDDGSTTASTDEGDVTIPDGGEGIYSLSEHHAGLMPDYNEATFTDVVIGREGPIKGMAFLATECGSLICLGMNRLMDKWVYLETDHAYSLSIKNGQIVCGCSDGIIRVFQAKSLEFVATLPFPQHKRMENTSPPELESDDQDDDDEDDEEHIVKGLYPNSLIVEWCNNGTHIVSVYDDKSLYVWDMSDRNKIVKKSTFHGHPTNVTGIVGLPHKNGIPDSMFMTCSDDRVLRFWKVGSGKKKKQSGKGIWANLFGNDIVHEIKIDEGRETTNSAGLKCISVSDDGMYIAAGDKAGGVYMYELHGKDGYTSIFADERAHSAEVMSVQFSPIIGRTGKRLLATGSRDRQVHVYEILANDGEDGETDNRKAPQRIKILKDHSAIVTALRFSMDGKKLLSAGGDKTIVLSSIQVDGKNNNVTISRQKSVNVPYGTVHDVDVDAINKYFCTAGQDKKISIWSISNGKPIRSYKPEGDLGEIHSIRLDPAGMFCATASHDKTIRLLEFYSGDCVAKSAGHGEAITGLAFGNDCKRLVSVGWDGCMFVWRLAPEITSDIRARQREIEVSKTLDEQQVMDDDDDEEDDDVLQRPEDEKRKKKPLFASDKLPAWAKTQKREGNNENTDSANNSNGGVAHMSSSSSSSASASSVEDVVQIQSEDDEDGDTNNEEEEHHDASSAALRSPGFQNSDKQQETTAPVADNETDDGKSMGSVLTAPRSPLPAFGQIRSLEEERKALKRRDRQMDTNAALEKMKSQLKGMGILQATLKQPSSLPVVQEDDTQLVLEDPVPPPIPPKPIVVPLSPPKTLEVPDVNPVQAGLNKTRFNGYVPGTPLRTAEDARSACEFALNEVAQALSNTMEIFKQVEKLDNNLGESLRSVKNNGDDFTSGVLETSRSHVRDVMGEFKQQLNGMITQELQTINSAVDVSQPLNTNSSMFGRSMFMSTPHYNNNNSNNNGASMQIMMEKLASISTMLEKVCEKQDSRE